MSSTPSPARRGARGGRGRGRGRGGRPSTAPPGQRRGASNDPHGQRRGASNDPHGQRRGASNDPHGQRRGASTPGPGGARRKTRPASPPTPAPAPVARALTLEDVRAVREERAAGLAALFGDRPQRSQYVKGFSTASNVRTLAAVGKARLWVALRSGDIQVRDVATGEVVRTVRVFEEGSATKQEYFFVNCIFAVPQGVWVGSSDGVCRLFDRRGERVISEARDQHTGGVKALAGNGEFVWSASEDFTVVQWRAATGEFVKQLVGHSAWVSSLVVCPATGHVWSCSADGIRVWDPTPPPEKGAEDGDNAEVEEEEGGEDVAAAAAAGGDKEEGHSCKDCLYLLSGHSSPVVSLTVVGGEIWSGDESGMVAVWDQRTRKRMRKFRAHKGPVYTAVAVDRTVWTSSVGPSLSVWDAATRKLEEELVIQSKSKVSSVAFAAGRAWVGCRTRGFLHLYRVYSPLQIGRVNPRPLRAEEEEEQEEEELAEPLPPLLEEAAGLPPMPSKEERLLLSTEELVALWNGRQRGPDTRLTDDGGGYMLLGTRRIRLAARQGNLLVRVGGGYIPLEEFVARERRAAMAHSASAGALPASSSPVRRTVSAESLPARLAGRVTASQPRVEVVEEVEVDSTALRQARADLARAEDELRTLRRRSTGAAADTRLLRSLVQALSATEGGRAELEALRESHPPVRRALEQRKLL